MAETPVAGLISSKIAPAAQVMEKGAPEIASMGVGEPGGPTSRFGRAGLPISLRRRIPSEMPEELAEAPKPIDVKAKPLPPSVPLRPTPQVPSSAFDERPSWTPPIKPVGPLWVWMRSYLDESWDSLGKMPMTHEEANSLLGDNDPHPNFDSTKLPGEYLDDSGVAVPGLAGPGQALFSRFLSHKYGPGRAAQLLLAGNAANWSSHILSPNYDQEVPSLAILAMRAAMEFAQIMASVVYQKAPKPAKQFVPPPEEEAAPPPRPMAPVVGEEAPAPSMEGERALPFALPQGGLESGKLSEYPAKMPVYPTIAALNVYGRLSGKVDKVAAAEQRKFSEGGHVTFPGVEGEHHDRRTHGTSQRGSERLFGGAVSANGLETATHANERRHAHGGENAANFSTGYDRRGLAGSRSPSRTKWRESFIDQMGEHLRLGTSRRLSPLRVMERNDPNDSYPILASRQFQREPNFGGKTADGDAPGENRNFGGTHEDNRGNSRSNRELSDAYFERPAVWATGSDSSLMQRKFAEGGPVRFSDGGPGDRHKEAMEHIAVAGKITEAKLAKHLGTDKATARETMRRLADQGLISLGGNAKSWTASHIKNDSQTGIDRPLNREEQEDNPRSFLESFEGVDFHRITKEEWISLNNNPMVRQSGMIYTKPQNEFEKRQEELSKAGASLSGGPTSLEDRRLTALRDAGIYAQKHGLKEPAAGSGYDAYAGFMYDAWQSHLRELSDPKETPEQRKFAEGGSVSEWTRSKSQGYNGDFDKFSRTDLSKQPIATAIQIRNVNAGVQGSTVVDANVGHFEAGRLNTQKNPVPVDGSALVLAKEERQVGSKFGIQWQVEKSATGSPLKVSQENNIGDHEGGNAAVAIPMVVHPENIFAKGGKIKGLKNLPEKYRDELPRIFKQVGIHPTTTTILKDYGGNEGVASVNPHTGDMEITKTAWDDKALRRRDDSWASYWQENLPSGYEDVPENLDPSFRGIVLHELGHVFDVQHHGPKVEDPRRPGQTMTVMNLPEIKEAALRISGHAHRSQKTADDETKPLYPDRILAKQEVFAEFFKAYVLGKPVPEILANHFAEHGVKRLPSPNERGPGPQNVLAQHPDLAATREGFRPPPGVSGIGMAQGGEISRAAETGPRPVQGIRPRPVVSLPSLAFRIGGHVTASALPHFTIQKNLAGVRKFAQGGYAGKVHPVHELAGGGIAGGSFVIRAAAAKFLGPDVQRKLDAWKVPAGFPHDSFQTHIQETGEQVAVESHELVVPPSKVAQLGKPTMERLNWAEKGPERRATGGGVRFFEKGGETHTAAEVDDNLARFTVESIGEHAIIARDTAPPSGFPSTITKSWGEIRRAADPDTWNGDDFQAAIYRRIQRQAYAMAKSEGRQLSHSPNFYVDMANYRVGQYGRRAEHRLTSPEEAMAKMHDLQAQHDLAEAMKQRELSAETQHGIEYSSGFQDAQAGVPWEPEIIERVAASRERPRDISLRDVSMPPRWEGRQNQNLQRYIRGYADATRMNMGLPILNEQERIQERIRFEGRERETREAAERAQREQQRLAEVAASEKREYGEAWTTTEIERPRQTEQAYKQTVRQEHEWRQETEREYAAFSREHKPFANPEAMRAANPANYSVRYNPPGWSTNPGIQVRSENPSFEPLYQGERIPDGPRDTTASSARHAIDTQTGQAMRHVRVERRNEEAAYDRKMSDWTRGTNDLDIKEERAERSIAASERLRGQMVQEQEDLEWARFYGNVDRGSGLNVDVAKADPANWRETAESSFLRPMHSFLGVGEGRYGTPKELVEATMQNLRHRRLAHEASQEAFDVAESEPLHAGVFEKRPSASEPGRFGVHEKGADNAWYFSTPEDAISRRAAEQRRAAGTVREERVAQEAKYLSLYEEAGRGKPPKGKFGNMGKSQAMIQYEDEDADSDLAEFLGIDDPDEAGQQVASMVGAPDGAEVTIRLLHRELDIEVEHPAFAGSQHRSITKSRSGDFEIINHSFFLNKQFRGKGEIGPQVVARSVENAQKFGVSKIHIPQAIRGGIDPHTNRPSAAGYYAWPRFGWDAPLGNISWSQTRREVGEAFPEAKTIQDVMATKEGRDWWQKHGSQINDLEFDLEEGSRSMEVFQKYGKETGKYAEGGFLTPDMVGLDLAESREPAMAESPRKFEGGGEKEVNPFAALLAAKPAKTLGSLSGLMERGERQESAEHPAWITPQAARDFAEGVASVGPRGYAGLVGKTTNTPEFQRFFGDSKVVDERGRPQVVFHGTGSPGFTVFDTIGGKDFGSHFGTEQQTHAFTAMGGEKSRVAPVFLNIKNPLRLPDLGRWNTVDWRMIDAIGKATGRADLEKHFEREGSYDSRLTQKNHVTDWLEKAGYDGIVYKNTHEGDKSDPQDSYIALRPNQIKSAVPGVNTQFSQHPDMTLAKGGPVRRFVTGGGTDEPGGTERGIALNVNWDEAIEPIAEGVGRHIKGIGRKNLARFARKVEKHIGALRLRSDEPVAVVPHESLGIPRTKMPQVPIEAFQKWLHGQGVTTERTTMSVRDMRPSQGEIGLEQIAKNVLKPEKKLAKKEIVVSQDNYIVDGHHGWAGKYLKDRDAESKILRINLPIREVLEKAHAFPEVFYKAIGQAHGGEVKSFDEGGSQQPRLMDYGNAGLPEHVAEHYKDLRTQIALAPARKEPVPQDRMGETPDAPTVVHERQPSRDYQAEFEELKVADVADHRHERYPYRWGQEQGKVRPKEPLWEQALWQAALLPQRPFDALLWGAKMAHQGVGAAARGIKAARKRFIGFSEGGDEEEARKIAPRKFGFIGPSKARTIWRPNKHVDSIAEQAAILSKVLGRGASENDIASLAGAPDDALVEYQIQKRPGNVSMIDIDVQHPEFEAHRRLIHSPQRHIRNEGLFVNDESQGKGIGSDVFVRQVEQARLKGFDKITTHAAKENIQEPNKPLSGYSFWPTVFGFDQSLQDIDDLDVLRKVYKEFPKARTVQDIVRAPGGADWWRAHGTDLFNAEFDLRDDSPSMRHFLERGSKSGKWAEGGAPRHFDKGSVVSKVGVAEPHPLMTDSETARYFGWAPMPESAAPNLTKRERSDRHAERMKEIPAGKQVRLPVREQYATRGAHDYVSASSPVPEEFGSKLGWAEGGDVEPLPLLEPARYLQLEHQLAYLDPGERAIMRRAVESGESIPQSILQRASDKGHDALVDITRILGPEVTASTPKSTRQLWDVKETSILHGSQQKRRQPVIEEDEEDEHRRFDKGGVAKVGLPEVHPLQFERTAASAYFGWDPIDETEKSSWKSGTARTRADMEADEKRLGVSPTKNIRLPVREQYATRGAHSYLDYPGDADLSVRKRYHDAHPQEISNLGWAEGGPIEGGSQLPIDVGGYIIRKAAAETMSALDPGLPLKLGATIVPGVGHTDSVSAMIEGGQPALVMPGEWILKGRKAKELGRETLDAMNHAEKVLPTQRFEDAGSVRREGHQERRAFWGRSGTTPTDQPQGFWGHEKSTLLAETPTPFKHDPHEMAAMRQRELYPEAFDESGKPKSFQSSQPLPESFLKFVGAVPTEPPSPPTVIGESMAAVAAQDARSRRILASYPGRPAVAAPAEPMPTAVQAPPEIIAAQVPTRRSEALRPAIMITHQADQGPVLVDEPLMPKRYESHDEFLMPQQKRRQSVIEEDEETERTSARGPRPVRPRMGFLERAGRAFLPGTFNLADQLTGRKERDADAMESYQEKLEAWRNPDEDLSGRPRLARRRQGFAERAGRTFLPGVFKLADQLMGRPDREQDEKEQHEERLADWKSQRSDRKTRKFFSDMFSDKNSPMPAMSAEGPSIRKGIGADAPGAGGVTTGLGDVLKKFEAAIDKLTDAVQELKEANKQRGSGSTQGAAVGAGHVQQQAASNRGPKFPPPPPQGQSVGGVANVINRQHDGKWS